jgi:ketosteroid isomerase-like protein
MMTPERTALAAIEAVEARDAQRLSELYDPTVVFEWPPGLPYSGRFHGADIDTMTRRFATVWAPLQPSATERGMDPVVVAASGDTVVIEYQWRAVAPGARRFETPVLARYRANGGRLTAAQMYYWDLPGLIEFLHETGW